MDDLDPVRLERQLGIVDKWEENNGKGTTLAVTGFGKTLVLLEGAKRCYNSPNAKTDRDVTVIVPSTALYNKWEKEFEQYEFESQVYTIQTLIRRFTKEEPLQTSILLVDEIHRYTAQEFGRLYNIVDYNFVFGASATLDEDDPKFDIIRKKAPVLDQVTLEEARENNWVSPFTIYNYGIELTPKERREYDNLTDKFNKYFATFDYDFGLARKCLNKDRVLRQHAKFMRWDKEAVKVHAVQFFRVMQKRVRFLANLNSKKEEAIKIINSFSDRIFITFSQSTDFAEDLAEEIGDEAVAYHSNLRTHIIDEDKNIIAKSVRVDGKKRYKDSEGEVYNWKGIKEAYPEKKLKRFGKKRRKEEALRKFQDKRYKIRVVSTAKALDEGVDFPDVNASIVTSGTSKTRQSIQRLGRMIRQKEDKQAFQVEIYAKDTQDERWLRKRQRESINVKYINDIDEINTT